MSKQNTLLLDRQQKDNKTVTSSKTSQICHLKDFQWNCDIMNFIYELKTEKKHYKKFKAKQETRQEVNNKI